jgi:hypothetical protein
VFNDLILLNKKNHGEKSHSYKMLLNVYSQLCGFLQSVS